eukprot:SAG31_NODE_1644_length_7652_cov_2.702502_6_plen_122_part_00
MAGGRAGDGEVGRESGTPSSLAVAVAVSGVQNACLGAPGSRGPSGSTLPASTGLYDRIIYPYHVFILIAGSSSSLLRFWIIISTKWAASGRLHILKARSAEMAVFFDLQRAVYIDSTGVLG